MSHLLGRFGGFVARTRWIIIIGWIVLLVVGAALKGDVATKLSGGGGDVPGSHSSIVVEEFTKEYESRVDASLLLVVSDKQKEVDSQEYQDNLKAATDKLKEEKIVKDVITMLDVPEEERAKMIGENGKTSISIVKLNVDDEEASTLLPEIQEKYGEYVKTLGIEANLVGTAAVLGDLSTFSKEGLVKAELIVLPLIFIILFIVFRSFMASLIPFIVTVVSVVGAMNVIGIVATYVEISVFVTNAAVMLGLGVAIDYSLFMVNRFRIELVKENDVKAAVRKMMYTTGHTVLFSGITVIAAMSVLFIVNVPAIKALAFGSITVVCIAVLSTLTLLPAILMILGHRINWGSIKWLSKSENGPSKNWVKWSNIVMKRPALFVLISLIVLIALAIPSIQLKLFTPDVTVLPKESSVRQGFEQLQESFGEGRLSPQYVLLKTEGDVLSEENQVFAFEFIERLKDKEEVTEVNSMLNILNGVQPEQVESLVSSDQLPNKAKQELSKYIGNDKKSMVIEYYARETAATEETRSLVQSLREEKVLGLNPPEGMSVYTGGETAASLDNNQEIFDSLLPSILMMLILIFIILMVTFKSILIPLKAIILNLLSVSATYGIVVLIFVNGYGAEILGVESIGNIVSFVPMLLLALLFGLSTDYEVFLLGRIQEEYRLTNNNEHSISIGLQQTGPLITGAAILMIAVFTGFAFSGILPIQALGVGLAVGVLIDATIVRMILVPATMKLLGKWNWWFPKFKWFPMFKKTSENKNFIEKT
ncbi:MMPL family transporter [Lysinibacillus fusiformis]|nr:MMPL family transporter [Lysinibacillus fusiformis]